MFRSFPARTVMNKPNQSARHIRMLSIVLVLGLSVSGCARKSVEPPAKKQQVVHGVQTEKTKLRTLDDTYEVTGSVRSKTVTNISSRVSATVIAIPVREGQLVKAGQILAELDSREARNAIEQSDIAVKRTSEAVNEADQSIAAARAGVAKAEANRKLAESTLARYRELFDRKSISPQEFDEVKAKYDLALTELTRDTSLLQVAQARKSQALASVEQARGELNRTKIAGTYFRIPAPGAGVISARLAEPGSIAMPGSPLLTLEDSSNYRLEVSVEESRFSGFHLGGTASVRIDAFGANEFPGRIVEIVPSADPQSHTFTVKLEIPFRQGLRSGLFGSARFSGTTQRKAITVPQSAIHMYGQMESLYVADESGVIHQRLIRTGKRFGDRIEVLSGVSEGDRVVVSGLEKVSDGVRIE